MRVIAPESYTVVKPARQLLLPEVEIVVSTATPVVRTETTLPLIQTNDNQTRMHELTDAVDAKTQYFQLSLEERIRLDCQSGYAYSYAALMDGECWNTL